MIIEPEKSQDQQLTSWRPRRTDGIISAQDQRTENQES